ncbi:MAG TPA: DEAD/DEAH box helicase, partial [Luteolibacter sp.]
MSEWNESGLKTAAGWKAFKDGKALHDTGMVTQAKTSPDGWTGSVREGKRVIRVGVKAPSNDRLEARCSCSENQATGAFCAHAVATGLALLGSRRPEIKTAVPSSGARLPVVQEALPKQALEVVLPPNWSDALSRGRLTVTVRPAKQAVPDDADVALLEWLAGQGLKAIQGPLPLALDAVRLPGFLAGLIGHSRVSAGEKSVLVSEGKRLEVVLPEEKEDILNLRFARAPLLLPGGVAWLLSGSEIARLGPGPLPEDLAVLMRESGSGRPVRLALRELLRRGPAWEDWIAVPEGSWLGEFRLIPASVSFRLRLDGSLQQLEAKLSAHYDGLPALVPGKPDEHHFPRQAAGIWFTQNLAAEFEALATLRGAGFFEKADSPGQYQLRGESTVLEFLAHRLPELKERWEVSEGDRFKSAHRSVAVVRPQLKVLGSGEDWLAFDYEFHADDGSVVSRAEVLQWLRSGRSNPVRGGKKLVLDQEAAELTESLFSELEIHQEQGRFIGPKALESIIQELGKNNRKQSIERHLGDFDSLSLPSTLGGGVGELLRGYQRQGIGWLHDRLTRFGGALLADDMGLGKTLQTIVAIEQVFAEGEGNGPALVIAPTSLLGNWKAEFQRFAPERSLRVLHGASREAEQKRVTDEDVIVTSYGTLARDLAWHLKREYRVVAVDEASLMRNPDTDHAKAIAKLRSKRRIALTGTPVENGVRDLWSIFRFIQPGWLGSREQFQERYEAPLQQTPRPVAPLERLRLKASPFLLRRTKEEVAADLPSKLIIDEWCDLSNDQRQIYRDLLGEGGKRVDETRQSAGAGAARLQLLTALLRLRQTCCDLALLKNERLGKLSIERRSAKLQRLLEIAEEAVLGNHRMLVFSQFQTQLQEIEKQLKALGIDSFRLDGQTRNRQDLVDRFQKADGPPVFLISLKAGGYGLNLTAADTVVHFDPWWNPAAEAQATDRAHRIGQTRPVTVYRLLTRGTVEEKVVRLQASKRELANATFDESGFSDASGLSDQD